MTDFPGLLRVLQAERVRFMLEAIREEREKTGLR